MTLMIWHIGRMLLLRGASLGIATAMAPAGKLALAFALAIGGFAGWSAWMREAGIRHERAQTEAITAQAEARALAAAADTSRKLIEITARDDAELAATARKEEKASHESLNLAPPGARGDVLWRADDRWLRGKR